MKTPLGQSLASVVLVVLTARLANAQIVTTFAGSGAAGSADGQWAAASFYAPAGVALDAAGNVYVADTRNARIRKIAPNGLVSTFADLAGGYPNDPTGVTIDGSGNLWEVDPVGDGIDGGDLLKFGPDGRNLGYNYQWPSVGLPPLNFVDFIAIAADQAGNLYSTSYLSGVIRFDTSGRGTVLAPGFFSARGITVDGFGNVYVADTDRNQIAKVAADGAIAVLAGSGAIGSTDGPAGTASFKGPQGLAVDGNGNVYVADTGNNRIRRITPDGVVTTLAGTGAAGDADGSGSDASFKAPTGIALDSAGNVFVGDTGNNKVRKIAALGAGCGPGCTNWTVPSVAHVAGADGAFWTSDLVLHNRGPAPAPVTLKFLGNSRDGTSGPERSFMLDPFQTVTYADVLSSVFGIANDAGALEVLTPSDQVTVRSRTFTSAAGGTVGDGVPGVRRSAFFTDQTSPSPVLAGLIEDPAFRTNLILVNGTAAIEVRVDAFDSSGAAIGSRTYTLPPLGMIQDSRFLTREDFGGRQRTDVTVTLSSPSPGAAFTALAVVIDNASNAPTTVLPQ